MELTYEHLNNMDLLVALKKINTCTTLNIKKKYWIARLVEKIMTERRRLEALGKGLLLKFCELDKDGQPVIDKEQGITFKPGQKDFYEKEFSELLEIKFDLGKIAPFNLEDFESAQLSPAEILVLLPILKDPEETTLETASAQ